MEINSNVIRSLRQRDKKAFEAVYNEYYKLIFFVAFKITKNEQLSLDIMQETFVKLMSNIENYFDNGKLKQYLVTIASNLAKNELQKRNNQTITLNENELHKNYSDNSKVGVMLLLEQHLDEQEIDIVSKKILFDYSFKEIAEDLFLTIGTVQSMYYKALEKLKDRLNKGDKHGKN